MYRHMTGIRIIALLGATFISAIAFSAFDFVRYTPLTGL